MIYNWLRDNRAFADKDVLKNPEALYLEFKHYFWLLNNLIVAQSEVTLNLYKALQNTGIDMPVSKLNYNLNETSL